jgi:hypothetical protein
MVSPSAHGYWISENPGGVFVPIDLDLNFPAKKLTRVERIGSPELKCLPTRLQHSHWQWSDKSDDTKIRLIVVMNGTSCEGLLAAKTQLWKTLRDKLPMLHVGYLESAPWNHRLHPDGAKYKGVGTNLLIGAILLSRILGANGAIGLHSLDDSVPVYRKWRMTSFGRDRRIEFSDMTYFEFSADQANFFLLSCGIV